MVTGLLLVILTRPSLNLGIILELSFAIVVLIIIVFGCLLLIILILNLLFMVSVNSYRVRVVDSIKHQSHYFDNLTYESAFELFELIVHFALDGSLSVWCCNIFKGKSKHSFKTFINHD